MKEKTNKNKINNDKFYLPTEDEINFFKKKSRVVNTDKSTANWVHQFENFREKAGFTDGKMKHVAEQGKANVQGADGLSVEECKKILYSPVLNIDTPTGLLKKVFFLNALFLALRGEYVSEDDYIIYNRWFQKFHVDNDQMEGSDVLEPLPHFSMPDKQALTPIELKSTFTSAREIFKAEINQESRIPFSNKSNKLTINETETLQDIFKGNGSIFNNCTFVFNR
ncbi:hypothetical protein GLOIN_2v1478488 [Rhizophagus irregularis DAOM 181602=DAOM 197198]|nr:hypothetical protein GLOIN_2v1478488 [Rhizophagus irregularis DAOM 181602=DAOM 197198]